MKNVRIALKEPENYAARTNLCQMAYLPMETQAIGTRSN
ncbi:MAG TPA: iron-containing alcohol dehydrogenase [Clostridiaceae bacterium]|nr:iron-containing alcohol dehydrogenase [Clostridiaceae bacterium]